MMLSILFISCKQQNKSTVIARVSDTELTREEAYEHIDTTHPTRDQQLAAYVASWVNAELIHQEAKRMNIETSEAFERRMSDIKRQLANQAFLNQYVYADSTTFSDSMLHAYYDVHLSEFPMREDMAKLHVVIFNSRERASAFATLVTRTSDWDAALADSAIAVSITSAPPRQYYSQHTLFPPELWKVATTLSINDISFPVKTSLGFAIVQPLAMIRLGKPAEFDLVRDEIRQRLTIEVRRKKYEELLGTLRKRYNVEVFTGSTQSSDTTHLHE